MISIPSRELIHCDNDKLAMRAKMNGYYESYIILKYLLAKIECVKGEEMRAEKIQELFHHLNSHPRILVYEPGFRRAVIDKISEFEEYILLRQQEFNSANYREALALMKLSFSRHIKHSKLRDEITKKLSDLQDSLDTYTVWMKSKTLLSELHITKKLLEDIKHDSNYVA